MIIELINTGTELMLGRVLNTHQQWICRQLTDLGYTVARQIAAPDTASAISSAVRESISRADIVITTGGLGPTSDDLTRDAIAGLLGRKLVEDAATVQAIESYFALRNRRPPQATRVQARIPEGALVLPNSFGTAPGLAMEAGSRENPRWLIMLPGPPRELQPMFREAVVPFLRKVAPPDSPFVCKTIRTMGIGESVLAELVEEKLRTRVEDGLQLGYCARPGEVDVRLAARGARADAIITEASLIVRELLAANIVTADDEALETAVIRELTASRQTLALAESCTGGYLAHRLTNVPGASAVLLAGLVTYSNEAKQRYLGVHPETLSQYGAVSEEVAREMADGVRRSMSSDLGLSITGIAGPSGGGPDKPVGTVFIGLSSSAITRTWRKFNPWDRITFKEVTARQAMERLLRLLKHGSID